MPEFRYNAKIQDQIAAKVVSVIIPILFVLALVIFIANRLFNPTQPFRLIPVGIIVLLVVISWLLTRFGNPRLAGHFITGVYVLAMISGMIFNGGSTAPIYASGMLVLIAHIAWLYSGRAALWASLGIIALGGLFLCLDVSGYLFLSPPPPPLARYLYSISFVLIMLAGTILPNRMLHQALNDSEKTRIQVQEASENVAKQEVALRESEKRFRTLVDNIPGVTYRCILDKDWTMEFISNEVENLTGYPASDFIDNRVRSFATLIHPDDNETVKKIVKESIAKKETYTLEYRIFISDGSECWVYEKGQGIFDPDGSLRWLDGVIMDITERKLAEDVLLKYKMVADSSKDILTVLDRDFKYVLANKAYLEKHKRPYVEGLHFKDVVGEQTFSFLKPHLERCLQGETSHVELFHEYPEVGLRHMDASYYPLKNNQGEILGIVGSVRDITDHREAEKALKESEQRHRTYIENAPDGIFVVDQEGRYVDVNRAACELTGYSREELLSMSVKEISLSDRPTMEMTVFQKLKDSGNVNTEIIIIRKDNKRINASFHGVALSDDRFMAFCSDLTEAKQVAGERLRLATVVEQAVELIVITDVDGTIQYVNPSFEKVTGYTRHEAIGQNPRILKSGIHDNDFYRNMWDTIAQGETWKGRITNKKKDGNLFEEEAVISPIRDETGRLVNYVAVKRDISQEIALEEQLQQSQKMEAIGRLAGGVAHDFNNLLTGITGYADMIRDSLEKEDPLVADIDEIHKAAERAGALTNQLLAFSRKQIITPKIVDLNEAITHSQKMLGRIIGEDVQLVFLPDENVGRIKADLSQLDQILVNLAVNARDAMPGGGKVTVETRSVRLEDERVSIGEDIQQISGDYVMLSVSDNGGGMDAETRRHIFEPFFSTKEKGKGTGLGLSTVYGIVTQNNGFITVYSEMDIGTTFRIYFPYVQQEADKIEKQETEKPPQGKETILLVEDEDMVRTLAKKILIRQGYKVIEADDGGAAYLQSKKYVGEIHLLLTDVIMPNMNGRELHRELLKGRPDLKVIFMSGYTDDFVANHGILEEGTQFIQKPFTVDQMARKVRDALDRQSS